MNSLLNHEARIKLIARLDRAMCKSGEPNEYTGTACWVWTMGLQGKFRNYGAISVDGKTNKVHRLMYALHVGPIPDGMLVRHLCNNPPCGRPDHLAIGTIQDNADDCTYSGRQATGDRSGSVLWPERRPRGEGHSSAKLSDADVYDIRAASAAGESGTSLAKKYGISHGALYRVVNRKTWAHLP